MTKKTLNSLTETQKTPRNAGNTHKEVELKPRGKRFRGIKNNNKKKITFQANAKLTRRDAKLTKTDAKLSQKDCKVP